MKRGGKPSPPEGSKKSKKRLLAERRVSKIAVCGKEGHLVVGWNKETDGYVGFYHPHSCGSLFCPYCGKRKRYKVLEPYVETLKTLTEPLALITITLRNSPDVGVIDYAFKSLSKLYDFRPFRPKVWRRVRKAFFEELKEYRENLKAKGFTAKQRAKKISYQLKLFREFVKTYRRYGKDAKLGQMLTVVWVFELTESEKGYHPHWHGILVGRIPKVLLVALWKLITDGEAYIADVRRIENPKEVGYYLSDYLSDGFIEVESGESSYEKMVEVEEALHGRRKVRAWGFDLIKGNNSDRNDLGLELKHIFKVRLRIWEHPSQPRNLGDFYRVKRKAKRRREGKEPYLVLEMEGSEYWFGRKVFLLGHLRKDGLIELEPLNMEQTEWEETLVMAYDYGGIEILLE